MSSFFTKLKNEISYDASVAVTNLETEAKKLESYIATKVASIEAHNKDILSSQSLIAAETALRDSAMATLTKIKSIL